jgi:ketosteroid isomerase-like protein
VTYQVALKENPMALDKDALSELLRALRAGGDIDMVRAGMELVAQALIELEAAQAIGAGRYERSPERATHRNGARERLLSTKAGDLELRIPKLRQGSFYPALLEPRRRIDRALWAVVMEAYVHGVSTRKVDDLVRALGIDAGISKSEVSRICSELDEQVSQFTGRPICDAFPYLFLDATYLKAHEGPQVVSKAVVIATGVRADGHREVLGLAVGDSEDGAFWTSFLRGLRARGLGGVRLVISDAHEGLRQSIGAVRREAEPVVAALAPPGCGRSARHGRGCAHPAESAEGGQDGTRGLADRPVPAIGSPQPPSAEGEEMGEARRVMDRATKALLSNDLEGLTELYAADAVAETPDEGTIRGREAIAAWLIRFNEAFPDASYELTRGYESGDTAIDEGYFVGTNTGPIAMPSGESIPATGRSVRLRACDVATVENGLVTSHRFYYDQMDFMGQLGLVVEE